MKIWQNHSSVAWPWHKYWCCWRLQCSSAHWLCSCKGVLRFVHLGTNQLLWREFGYCVGSTPNMSPRDVTAFSAWRYGKSSFWMKLNARKVDNSTWSVRRTVNQVTARMTRRAAPWFETAFIEFRSSCYSHSNLQIQKAWKEESKNNQPTTQPQEEQKTSLLGRLKSLFGG